MNRYGSPGGAARTIGRGVYADDADGRRE